MEPNPNLDLISDILTLLYSSLEALEKFIIYCTDLSSVLSLIESILTKYVSLLSDISEQILSLIKLTLKFTNQSQHLSLIIQKFLFENPLDLSILLLPSISFICQYSTSNLDSHLLLRYIQNSLQVYYNDDFLLTSITFTLKQLLISSVILSSQILPTILALLPQCDGYLAHCLKTTIFVSIIFQPQNTLDLFDSLNSFQLLLNMLKQYSTLKNDFYTTKILVLTLITLIDTPSPLDQVSLLQLLIPFLQSLYLYRNTYSQAIISISEDDNDNESPQCEEEPVPMLIELNDNAILSQLIQKLISKNAPILQTLTSEQMIFLKRILHL
ncbi:hypothetical protein EDI_050990 [Entamoeba dispar SAW760]|uniref:Uncharacterized protein n=1 Tax=Entamoeba dispar (strain ATCC PRA-260 / SAW760) TaxID=370354 RepID=B0EAC2_ENTDS|nr:uncharacterized protein EDI_050990 [Entamoeba dispar SAW760]EDR28527.1 hypothetical protein EDI_050990 [Entamoeba dispar SAW760]|eukprot:EDR28527.1 hypothetical protein EDI_050990 [Entamoeba dispar SAW760]